MATINDLPKLEGIRDFFRSEIYGEVGKLLEAKGVFGDRSDPLYMESLSIMGEANKLVDILWNDGRSSEEKDQYIEKTVQQLTERLAVLKQKLL